MSDPKPKEDSGIGPADGLPVDLDAELVRRALTGDDTAFELIVVRYQRRIAAAIRRLVPDHRIIEELSQEVFLRLYAALADFDPQGHFAGWLFAIARNTTLDYLRSRQNAIDDAPLDAESADALMAARSAADGSETFTRFDASVEEQVAARQLFAAIDAAIAALPPPHRRALLMREIDGLDYQSIAAALAVPLNTAKSHVLRARAAVAAQIEPMLAGTRDRRW